MLAEIRTTARLQHPHMLPLFDSGEATGLLFQVMPYIEGKVQALDVHRAVTGTQGSRTREG